VYTSHSPNGQTRYYAMGRGQASLGVFDTAVEAAVAYAAAISEPGQSASNPNPTAEAPPASDEGTILCGLNGCILADRHAGMCIPFEPFMRGVKRGRTSGRAQPMSDAEKRVRP